MRPRASNHRARPSSTPTAAIVASLALAVGGCGDAPVDATTAAPADVAAVPSTPGDKRFEVTVSPDGEATTHVVAAGPGFAVLAENSLTGYGGDGVERWHYRPSDTEISDIHAYDDGAARC